ncbi:MAG: aminodeoxychorismate synthase component I, partial [Kiloniellales bacterium]|nr:aminodeoxychorismate synthase component I [Kiloniellales bacterium]
SGTFVLLDDSLKKNRASRLFENPLEIVSCSDPSDVDRAIERIVEAGKDGLYAAGFLSYELGYLLEPKLSPLFPANLSQPLVWMGLFNEPASLSDEDTRRFLGEGARNDPSVVENLELSWDEPRYLEAFNKVKDYIAAGDVYQINLTLKYLFKFAGDPLKLYSELRRKQRVSYGALISGEDFKLLSLSPELFIRTEGDSAQVRPMKGTAPRGRTPQEDNALAAWLQSDPKSRAENLMIVDLLRNDLGRSALIGSVRVSDLFTVEHYPTLLQMTSGVTAKLHPAAGLKELLVSLFPCGSVTGAPKVRAMEIIRELESGPRGIYTGAIGMIKPSGDLSFNVAIRSLWLQPSPGSNSGAADSTFSGEMGIGSGIVFDSEGPAEYKECLLKAEFLTKPSQDFHLFETLRWESGAFWLLRQHLDRLEASAAHFLYPYDEDAVRVALRNAAADFQEGLCYRVRLSLLHDGELTVTAHEMSPPGPGALYRYVLSDKRVDSSDVFLYHKTTMRALYDAEHKKHAEATGCDEVFFLNERGELAEGSRSNIFVAKEGVLLTPPVDAGLLPGTFRRYLIEEQDFPVVEQTLYPDDLDDAEAVYLGNSVRGLVKVERV